MRDLSEKICGGIILLAWTGAFVALCIETAGYAIKGNCQTYQNHIEQTLPKKQAIKYCKQLNCGELEKLTKDCYKKNETRN